MKQEILFLIFKDSLFAHFIFTFDYEFAYSFAAAFGFNNFFVTAAAYAGSVLGLVSSFLIFYFASHLFKKSVESGYNYKPFRHYFNKFKFITLSVCMFSHISVLAPFFAGLLRINIKSTIVIISLYRLCYYIYMTYNF